VRRERRDGRLGDHERRLQVDADLAIEVLHRGLLDGTEGGETAVGEKEGLQQQGDESDDDTRRPHDLAVEGSMDRLSPGVALLRGDAHEQRSQPSPHLLESHSALCRILPALRRGIWHGRGY